MDYNEYEKLKDKMCKEIEELSKGSLGMGEIEALDKLTHSIKSINAIQEHNDRMGYSKGMWRADGSYRDDSYANRQGMHYVKGHYSRAKQDISEAIEDMLDNDALDMDDRATLRRAYDVIRK